MSAKPSKAAPKAAPKKTKTSDCTVIACLQIRGGTGKTTTVEILAGVLAQRGKKVLVVDMDNNTALSSDLGVWVQSPERSISWAIMHDLDLKPFILTTKTPNLFLIPQKEGFKDDLISNILLNKAAAKGLETTKDREPMMREPFKRLLEPLKEHFDYIILDTVSKEDAILTRMALHASDYCIVTMKPKGSDVPKVQSALRYFEQARGYGNPVLELLGIHVTWAPKGVVGSGQVSRAIKKIPKSLEPLLFKTAMRDCDALIEMARRKSICLGAYPRELVKSSEQWGSPFKGGKRVTRPEGAVELGSSKDGSTILDDMDSFVDEVLERIQQNFFARNGKDYQDFIQLGIKNDWVFLPNETVTILHEDRQEELKNA